MRTRLTLLLLLLVSQGWAQTLPSPSQGGTGSSNTASNQCHLRGDGTNFITSCVLQDNGTDATDTGKLTVQGSTSKFGTAGTAHIMEVGQGASGSEPATLRVKAGNSTTAAVPKIDLRRGAIDVSEWRTDGFSTYFDYAGTLFFGSNVGNPLTLDINGSMGIGNANVPYTSAVPGLTPAFNIGGSGTAGAFQVDQTGNVTSAAYVAAVNTWTAPALSYVVPTGYRLEFNGTQHLVGTMTGHGLGTARTRGRDDNKNVTTEAVNPGSLTITNARYRLYPRRQMFSGNARLTIRGNGFLRGIS